MSLGGIIGKLIGGVAGGLLGGQPKVGQATQTPAAIAPQKKIAKAGRLALIKTKQTGVFNETTLGRGKLFGN